MSWWIRRPARDRIAQAGALAQWTSQGSPYVRRVYFPAAQELAEAGPVGWGFGDACPTCRHGVKWGRPARLRRAVEEPAAPKTPLGRCAVLGTCTGTPEGHTCPEPQALGRDDVHARRTCTRVPPDRTPGRCAALCRQHAHRTCNALQVQCR